jgi:dihydroneopterin aldolase
MLTIQLNQLEFYGYHGVYAEERKTGGVYVVQCVLHYFPQAGVVTELDQTVNYEEVYALIKLRMAEPTPLLETIAMQLCYSIMEKFGQVEQVYVHVEKKNPPIPAFSGSVSVSYQLARE